MLQQTQVTRVAERFGVFVKRFPNVRALAAASEQEVLALWQGMGYYRRARNLHAAARAILRDHGGRVPRRAETLRRLPGVGRYTAGAIASIVYGKPEAAVDGNVQRVLARWRAWEGPQDAAMRRRAWSEAERLVALAADPGCLNEALMELGATVCTPRGPRCEACPVAAWCRARQRDLQNRVPAPKTGVVRRSVHHHAVVIKRPDGRVFLEKRGPDGLWGAMWQVPTVESDTRLSRAEVETKLPVAVRDLARLETFEHATTHRRISFHVFAAKGLGRSGTWRRPEETQDLPMSNAQRRVLEVGSLPGAPGTAGI
jgi:A/G-specific adenine glycosylase